MTETQNNSQPWHRRHRPLLILILIALLVLVVGSGFWLQKRQDLGDCYDKYQRWDYRAEVCR